jgi:hypothetical protein
MKFRPRGRHSSFDHGILQLAEYSRRQNGYRRSEWMKIGNSEGSKRSYYLGRDVGSAWIRWNPTMYARIQSTEFSCWGNTSFETVLRRSIPRSESSIQLHRSSQDVSSLSLNFSVLRDRTWFVSFNQLVPWIICDLRDTFWNIRHISSLKAILFVTAPWPKLPLGTLISCSGELSPKWNSKFTPP